MLRNKEKNKDNWYYRLHTETKVEMGWTWYSKHEAIEGQQVEQSLHRVASKEREEIKRTTMQKMARQHNKEGGNHLEKESNRQKTMADNDGGLHPAVDGQSLSENERWI